MGCFLRRLAGGLLYESSEAAQLMLVQKCLKVIFGENFHLNLGCSGNQLESSYKIAGEKLNF